MSIWIHGHHRLFLVTVEVERPSGSVRTERVLVPTDRREVEPAMEAAVRAVTRVETTGQIVRVLEARRLQVEELPWTMLAVEEGEGEEA